MDIKAMFRFSYGLYVLTAQENAFDNGCIVTTAIQVTDTPNKITVTVNKANKTCEMIHATGKFNVCMLTENAPFDVYKHFGFQSGRTADKFADFTQKARSENGLYYITEYANAYVSGKVIQEVDMDTHIMFIAEVPDAVLLSDIPSVTYTYYQDHIKPRPQETPTAEKGKTKWVCRICGFIYEGEELPPDYICPVCKHGVQDFEKITV